MKNLDRFLRGEIIYHCGTKEKAHHLLEGLGKRGIKWSNGATLTRGDSRWRVCYALEEGVLWYASKGYCEENKYEIVEYEVEENNEVEKKLYTSEMIAELDIYRNKV